MNDDWFSKFFNYTIKKDKKKKDKKEDQDKEEKEKKLGEYKTDVNKISNLEEKLDYNEFKKKREKEIKDPLFHIRNIDKALTKAGEIYSDFHLDNIRKSKEKDSNLEDIKKSEAKRLLTLIKLYDRPLEELTYTYAKKNYPSLHNLFKKKDLKRDDWYKALEQFGLSKERIRNIREKEKHCKIKRRPSKHPALDKIINMDEIYEAVRIHAKELEEEPREKPKVIPEKEEILNIVRSWHDSASSSDNRQPTEFLTHSEIGAYYHSIQDFLESAFSTIKLEEIRRNDPNRAELNEEEEKEIKNEAKSETNKLREFRYKRKDRLSPNLIPLDLCLINLDNWNSELLIQELNLIINNKNYKEFVLSKEQLIELRKRIKKESYSLDTNSFLSDDLKKEALMCIYFPQRLSQTFQLEQNQSKDLRGCVKRVYLARDSEQGREGLPIALKFIILDEDLKKVMEQQNKTIEEIIYKEILEGKIKNTHTNLAYNRIATIYGHRFLVEERIDRFLSEYVNEKKQKQETLDLDEILHISEGIVEGMKILHKAGIVHGDLKAENIGYIDQSDEEDEEEDEYGIPMITDYGISTIYNYAKEDRERNGGSVYITPPPVFLGAKLDKKSDIYAFGSLLYYLFEQEYPLEKELIDRCDTRSYGFKHLGTYLKKYKDKKLLETKVDETLKDKDIPIEFKYLIKDCILQKYKSGKELKKALHKAKETYHKRKAQEHYMSTQDERREKDSITDPMSATQFETKEKGKLIDKYLIRLASGIGITVVALATFFGFKALPSESTEQILNEVKRKKDAIVTRFVNQEKILLESEIECPEDFTSVDINHEEYPSHFNYHKKKHKDKTIVDKIITEWLKTSIELGIEEEKTINHYKQRYFTITRGSTLDTSYQEFSEYLREIMKHTINLYANNNTIDLEDLITGTLIGSNELSRIQKENKTLDFNKYIIANKQSNHGEFIISEDQQLFLRTLRNNILKNLPEHIIISEEKANNPSSILSSYNPDSLEVVNTAFDTEVSIYKKHDFYKENKYLKIEHGETLKILFNLNDKNPHDINPFKNISESYVTQAYIEGLDNIVLNKGLITAPIFDTCLYEPYMYYNNSDTININIPENMNQGIYKLIIETYLTNKKGLPTKNSKALTRKTIPIVIGDPNFLISVNKIDMIWFETKVSFNSINNKNDIKGLQYKIKYEIPELQFKEENTIETCNHNWTSDRIGLPKIDEIHSIIKSNNNPLKFRKVSIKNSDLQYEISRDFYTLKTIIENEKGEFITQSFIPVRIRKSGDTYSFEKSVPTPEFAHRIAKHSSNE